MRPGALSDPWLAKTYFWPACVCLRLFMSSNIDHRNPTNISNQHNAVCLLRKPIISKSNAFQCRRCEARPLPRILNKEICNVSCITTSTHHFQVCCPSQRRALFARSLDGILGKAVKTCQDLQEFAVLVLTCDWKLWQTASISTK